MKVRPAFLTLALATSGIGLAHAQATLKPDGQFRAALGLGFSASSGNSDASNFSLTIDAVRATEQDKTSLYGNAQYARTEGETTADQVRLGGRQDRNLSPATFAFGGLDFERNRFTNLKLRSQLSGGLGWHVIKGETTTFDLFGGLSYSADEYLDPMFVGGENRSSYSYLGLMLGAESTHRLSDNTSAKQRLTVVPNLDDRCEYRANWDAGLAVAMSKRMNLKLGFSVAYNSDPGSRRLSTDTLFTTGIAVKFE